MSERRRFYPVWAAVVGVLMACGDDAPPPEPVIRPVKTQKVYASGGERVRAFPGTARAALESQLSFKVQGTIEEIRVDVGDKVRAGQVLARLDPKDFELQVENGRAQLASTEAQAVNAEASYKRVQDLWQNDNASASDLDAARARAVSAHENVISAKKSLELMELQLSYTELKAPVEGAIAAVPPEVNENVGPGQPVVLLTSGSQLEVGVAVPGVLIAKIREGGEVEVAFDALEDQRFTARVTEVGVAATGGTTTFPVAVLIDHPDPACRPGMAATVSFRFGGSGRAKLFAPSVAVGADRDGRFIYVVQAQGEGFGVVRRRPVQVSDEITAEGLEIISGLEDGEEVVIRGVTRIVDGQKVRLLGAE